MKGKGKKYIFTHKNVIHVSTNKYFHIFAFTMSLVSCPGHHSIRNPRKVSDVVPSLERQQTANLFLGKFIALSLLKMKEQGRLFEAPPPRSFHHPPSFECPAKALSTLSPKLKDTHTHTKSNLHMLMGADQKIQFIKLSLHTHTLS